MDICEKNNNLYITGITNFDLKQTFECGQCFRWNENPDGSYTGVAFGRALTISMHDGVVCLHETSEEDFRNIWYDYFDFGRDYSAIKAALSHDPVLKKAICCGSGIRILRQECSETIISFIISASNNIPRIKKIVETLCTSFGDKIEYMGNIYYSFPSPKSLSEVSTEDLSVIRAGFRDKYIVDAVRRLVSGELDPEKLKNADCAEAKKELMKVYGIGSKVADCILLFGLAHTEAFPVDVWIKRIIEICYFDSKQKIPDVLSFAENKFGELAGFAQQYLFYYARENKITG